MTMWDTVAKLDEIPDDGMKQVVVKGEPVGLYRVGDDVYAISDYCSHEQTYLTDGEFDPELLEVECPLHGSRFNIVDGSVRILPATRPVPAYDVVVEGDLVKVAVPES